MSTDYTEAYDRFVPDSTKENYREIARDRARVEGTTPKAELSKLASGFEAQAKSDPLGGWEYLAAWAKAEGDPGDGAVGDSLAFSVAREVESAKRDPRTALSASDEAVKAAEDEVKRRADKGLNPGVEDAGDGVIPNPGPAPVSKKAASGKAAK